MAAVAKKINDRVELVYDDNDKQKAAEAILRVSTDLRSYYSVSDVMAVLSSAHGIMSLTCHCLRAAAELRKWHKDITKLAMVLAIQCYGNIKWGVTDVHRP